MATSSITKSFVITSDQAETFVNAIEESAKNRPVRIQVAARELTDTQEIAELMRKRKRNRANGGNR